ncbi:MAG: HDOD domain-containing protein [Deltaproteobacteria bacterium]|jgi:putative nucleotidyltransferase with HDIG domain|nr:HDOD domain-containing protein [Deltaproteobacteria bacterium]MBW2486317.1 HDOD domain-containing protein [Deltaproteobacteria bacterium]
MDEQQILVKLDRIKDIPTLPAIVFELNKYLRDPDTSIKTVCETIEKDQAIALKILKLVNSAFYGFKSKISDLRNAVVLLGYNAVRNAIVSLSVINAFPKRVKLMDFDISQFWKHSLAVAVTSKNIAQLSKKESPDNCFVGGLLHDVGKVILAQYFPKLFEAVWFTLQKEHLTFYQAERKRLPIDHSKIGAHLAAKWQLPQGLIDAIRWHHDFQPNTKSANFVKNIYLANFIVNAYDMDPDLRLDLSKMHPEVTQFMMNMMEDVGDWYTGLTGEIDSAYAFFLETDV